VSQTQHRLADVMVVTKVRNRPWTRRPVRTSVLALALGVAVGAVGVTATRSDAATRSNPAARSGAATTMTVALPAPADAVR
jgi:hypothetical protein